MQSVKFKNYPFAECPDCGECHAKVIKDENYFEHNLQYIDFACLNCGIVFRAKNQ